MMRKDDELEDSAYLFETVHGTYSEAHNNANLRSIAISLKRIADALHSEVERIGIGTFLSEISDYCNKHLSKPEA